MFTFIIYGEEGETEYGGETGHEERYFADENFIRNIYHEGNDLRRYLDAYTEQDLKWWILPDSTSLKKII